MLEVDGEVEILVDTNIDVAASNTDIAIIEDTNDIEVTVNRQEYVITGDEIYIPKRYEDAPTWMQNLITEVVNVSIAAEIQDLNQISQSLESMIDSMEVAKNTYEMSVISSNDIDERINTAITTLNSSMNTADATVLSVAQTRVTPAEASAITVDVITAELANTEAGTLGAAVADLQTAIANEEEARSSSIEVLTSSIEGAFDANATAMNYINTYVGLDEVGASTGTGLSGYLEGSTGIIGEADSKVVNNVYVDAVGNAKSKFEYGSTVTVNGVTHNAGFGLSNSAGTAIGSEFWINADKFKFTNSNKTGSKAPFTIDATGAVPEITFNGLVTFNSVDSVYSTKVDTNNDAFAQRLGYLSYADMVVAAESGQTIINGGYLRGELIEANSITARQIDAYAIAGKTITGGTITGTQIIGSVIKGSFIDLTTTLALTNWQYYTPATIPGAYAGNFAHHNDGGLVVDSEGYVRLTGQQNFMVPVLALNGTIWSGDLSNVTTHPSVNINRSWDLYSWDSYNLYTLQRSIRSDTQFSSGGNLVFAGSCICDDFDNSGTDTINYGTYRFRVLNTDIEVRAQASNGNEHTAEISQIYFNGSLVSYADGRFGEQSGSDCASVSYNSNIKGLPINITVTFNGGASFWVTSTIMIASNSRIYGHTINDVFRIDSISHSLNTASTSGVGYTSCNYSINYPSIWVM